MDYFKHYSTASDSKSMNLIFDKFGHKGIAFWWMFVELCSENWDGVSEPEFSFHQRTVVTKLKSSLNSVRTWLELCSNSGLCAFAQSGTQFEIKMPKLKEIKESRGRIKGNKSEKIDIYRLDIDLDKDIDKESKKVVEGTLDLEQAKAGLRLSNHFSSFDECELRPEQDPAIVYNFRQRISGAECSEVRPDTLIQMFNDKLAMKAGKIQYCRGLSSDQIKSLVTTISFKEFSTLQVWEEIFQKVSKSPFLHGAQKGSNFVATLDWLVVHGNALKVINGKYQEAPEGGEKAGSIEDYINAVELS